MNNDIIEFLRESNNIENEWDDLSLQQSLFAWNYIVEEDKLTEGVILKTHKILMLHHPLQPDEKGYFRKVAVGMNLANGTFKEFKPWYAVPELLKQWIVNANDLVKNGFNDNEKLLEKLNQEHHINFEAIHPFIDGNGRMGRILMNWQRYELGLPILIIKEKEKDKYYSWFD